VDYNACTRMPDPDAPDRRFLDAYYTRYWTESRLKPAVERARQRHRLIESALPFRKGRALDAGTGHGVNVPWLASLGFDVTACDMDAQSVARVREWGFSAFQCDLERADPSTLGPPYDLIVCMEVLEHLVDPVAVLESLARLIARPNGILLASCPNEFHILRRLQIAGGIHRFGGHDWPHLRFFTPDSAEVMFKSAGWDILERRGQPIPPARYAALERLLLPLSSWWPSMFAFSTVYLLQPASAK
jgi:2-polyprenyl-3-methyl-5-hydroxy-6-metoxy-1,4-benzoquinol methylase